MEGLELERLERIIRNTDAEKIQLERSTSPVGDVFMAYGANPKGDVRAIWGCRGIARTIDFKDGTRVEAVRQVLLDDAVSFISSCIERGLIAGQAKRR